MNATRTPKAFAFSADDVWSSDTICPPFLRTFHERSCISLPIRIEHDVDGARDIIMPKFSFSLLFSGCDD
jgi:hypothetical protein